MLRSRALICLFFTINTFAIQPPFLQEANASTEALLKTLTLRQKIGQLFMVPATSIFYTPDDPLAPTQRDSPYNVDPDYVTMLIKEYHIGGLIFLFKSEPDLQRKYIERYQAESKIPLLVGQDLEWGLSQSLDHDPSKVTRYPHLMTLGALSKENEYLIYELGKEIGKQCAQIGVHMNFAPVVDVNNNAQNPVIHDRSFGDDPQKVARLAALYARGIQDAGVIAVIKHLPGHGDTEDDSHETLPKIKHTRARLNKIELPPFQALIDAGIGGVMIAHLQVPALDARPNRPSSLSYNVVTNLLKNEFHFKGLAITDGLGMKAITNHYAPGDLELEALLAGNDILLCPLNVPRAVELIEQAICDGKISEADLDQRVLKILQAKEWAFKQHQKNVCDDPDAYLVRPEAFALQRELYRKTITVARNTLEVPFSDSLFEHSCIIQVGGTPNIQFKKHAPTLRHVPAAMSDTNVAHCLNAASQNDTVVMLINGMNKFADKDFGVSANTCLLIRQLKGQGKKIVAVIFGSPYSIRYFNDADAIIMAYAYKDTPALWEATLDVLRGTLKAEGVLPVAVPM